MMFNSGGVGGDVGGECAGEVDKAAWEFGYLIGVRDKDFSRPWILLVSFMGTAMGTYLGSSGFLALAPGTIYTRLLRHCDLQVRNDNTQHS